MTSSSEAYATDPFTAAIIKRATGEIPSNVNEQRKLQAAQLILTQIHYARNLPKGTELHQQAEDLLRGSLAMYRILCEEP